MQEVMAEIFSNIVSLAVGGLIGYDDGTCQNPKCVNYTEEEQNENKETTKANGGES